MKKFIYILLIFNLAMLNKSFALIEVDITRGNLDPLPIAVSPLHVDIKSENHANLKIKNLGEDISKIIEKILEIPVYLTSKERCICPKTRHCTFETKI